VGVELGPGVPVGVAVGLGVPVGVTVGRGVPVGVAVGRGVPVGVALGLGVPVGVALGRGVAVGVAVPATTLTIPTMPQQAPCGVQWYAKFPTLLKVCVNTAPWFKTVESQRPFGIPGVPEVLLWPLELQVQRTVSPGSIVTDEGEKKNPPLPTVTSTVLAVAAVG
jgi:hypothetical protein